MKKNDYLILSVICFFLGIFIVSQYYTAKTYKKVTQPENNEVIALEVAKLTKSNSDLRHEAQLLTGDLEAYQNSSESRKKAYEQYNQDMSRLETINGKKTELGQGVIIKIEGSLETPQVVDLVNAIKNIGSEVIQINSKRVSLNTNLQDFSRQAELEIRVLGNSEILKSALERKGGILEQLTSQNLKYSLFSSSNIEISPGNQINFIYSKILDENK